MTTINSLSDLDKLKLKPKPATTRNRKLSEGENLRKLVAKVGTIKAAAMLGVSRPCIDSALRHNKITAAIEVAAAGVWFRYFEKPAANTTVTLVVPTETWGVLKPQLEGLAGVSIHEIL